MFCFQCEQTAQGKGCAGSAGVCGKKGDTAGLQDGLTAAMIGLARAAGDNISPEVDDFLIDGLFTTVTNVSFSNDTTQKLINRAAALKSEFTGGCACCAAKCSKNDEYDMDSLWKSDEDIRSLKSLILFGIRGMAAYAHHAAALGLRDARVSEFIRRALVVIGEDLTAGELLPVVLETGEVNLVCMEMLDRANTGAYGDPYPATVTLIIERGPFIVISGHDLHDLKLLLEQTKDKGVNIYTHGEMLPAHAYPELRAYPQLKGNFGTAWQNQQKEFDGIPAPVLFTTNCLMPVKDSYKDRVFTTSVMAYPEIVHIDDKKDFTPVINRALELGGYDDDKLMTGINGGHTVTTGFGRATVMSAAGTVIDSVKSGALRHIFLVGGCDGARTGRNYYTEFVRLTPPDTLVLTLACGKYRFNDIDAGTLGGLPRILDMGQCNDAYGAVKVALALADAFGCGVNDLPLSLVLSWYEQKAVCILLTLLYLGVKNIRIGPSLPAFISPNVLDILVREYGLTPIGDPADDLAKMLAK